MAHRGCTAPAAFRNLDAETRADLTKRYDALCAHSGMEPTRNNTGIAHENGAIESAHGHVKAAVEDALLLRGSSDFASLADYRRFIDEVITARNRRHAPGIDAERKYLQALPRNRTLDYEDVLVGVAREQAVPIHQPHQRHGLAPQRVDNVPIVDDMAMLAAGLAAPPGKVISGVLPRSTSSRSS